MVQDLFESYIFLYVMAGLCGVGIFIKLVTNIVYKCLVKASDNMANSKNKLMKMVKMKFEACYKLKIGVHNVDTFVDKYVFRYKFCGIFLYTWENIGGQLLMLSLLTGVIGAALGLVYDCGKVEILSTFFAGILSSALLIIFESFINLPAKRTMVKLNMKDYLENMLKVRLEQEYFNPEQLNAYRNEYFKKEDAIYEKPDAEDGEDMRELMASLADMAISNEAASEEKVQEQSMIKKATLQRRGKNAIEIPEQKREEKQIKQRKNNKVYELDKNEEVIIEDILKEFMA